MTKFTMLFPLFFFNSIFNVMAAVEDLCNRKTEDVLFSCVVQPTERTVSLCAPKNIGPEKGGFLFKLGYPTGIEVTLPKYPKVGEVFYGYRKYDNGKKITWVSFPNRQTNKYIVYNLTSIEGISLQSGLIFFDETIQLHYRCANQSPLTYLNANFLRDIGLPEDQLDFQFDR